MMSKAKERKTAREKPAAKRIPLERKIELRFPTFEGLVTSVSKNLSVTGMFIQTAERVPVGTEFSFRLRIEEWSPLQGRARVVWRRSSAEGPDRPAGLGVQFTELDGQSRRMIRWLVDRNVQDGGQPFDVGHVPEDASNEVDLEALDETIRSAVGDEFQDRSTEVPSATASRGWIRTLLYILMAVALGVGGYVLTQNRRVENRTDLSANRPSERQVEHPLSQADSLPIEDSDDSPAVIAPLDAEAESMIASTVRAWATAWTSQDAEALAALTTEDFSPQNGVLRENWLTEVRRQMETLEFIRVAISGLEIDIESEASAVARFNASVRTNERDEISRRELELTVVAGEWRIRRERQID